MMGKSMEQIELLADRVFLAVKAHIATSVGAITKRLDEFEQRLREIPAGKDGAPGKDGEHGKDADNDAIEERITRRLDDLVAALPMPKDGTPGADAEPVDYTKIGSIVRELIQHLPPPFDGSPGEKGLTGDRGETGEPGPKGDSGTDGERGEKGDPGIDGANGLPGENGQDGQPGQDGERGDPGRDALQLEIVPQIDAGKAYPRGTYASHRGGLVRAMRNTDALTGTLEQAGWTVMVEGVADVGVEQGEDLRSFAIGIELTSGKASVHKFVSPVMIHRGVFKAGTEYARGDAVTWDGSTWHCDHETKAEPGNTTDWRLIVKRGAPGKDGASVKGDQGTPGRNGLDLTNMAPDGSKYR